MPQPQKRDISEWFLAKIPKGFENFFPKNGRGAGTAGRSKTGKVPTSKSSNSGGEKAKSESKFQFKGKKNRSNNNKNNNNNPENPLGASLATLGALGLLMAINSDREGGREIQWSELRSFLTHDRIDRIQILPNKNIARILLTNHATNINSSASSTNSGMDSSANTLEFRDGFDTEDTMDLGTSSSQQQKRFQNQQQHQQYPATSSYYINISTPEAFERKLEDLQKSLKTPLDKYVNVQYTHETGTLDVIKALTPVIVLGGIMLFMNSRLGGGGATGGMGGFGGGGGGPGGIFRVGKSNAKQISAEEVDVKFADVAGCDEAKAEIMEFVSFLQTPEIFEKLGAKIPKGALLCGPPGTGKTLLAKAVAGEAGVPFYSISGSDFIEMFVGVGPARVRDLFETARKNAPCIIFIDEIDAVGRKRGRGNFGGGNDERENTLNQLLVEMDGFASNGGDSKEDKDNTVVVLAGTNRADILDQALIRPGRFDRQITVDKPDLEGRRAIFAVHLKGLSLSASSNDNNDKAGSTTSSASTEAAAIVPDDNEEAIRNFANRLAALTPGFAGADIANICNEAAIVAARRRADYIEMQDFDKAVDRVVGGMEKTRTGGNSLINKKELEIISHHEAGHAIAGWFLEHADPLLKVTIVPRSNGALGFAQYLPREMHLRSMPQIMDVVCMALAGRAAEQVFFGTGNITTGASDDLRKVTAMIYQTIQIYGMNERIGQLAFPKDDAGGGFGEEKKYSDATAQAMDEEAKRIVDEAYARTVRLIEERKEEVQKVAQLLLEKETIHHDDVLELVGERPFEKDPAYQQYVSSRKSSEEDGSEDKSSRDDEKKEDEVTGGSGGAGLVPGLV